MLIVTAFVRLLKFLNQLFNLSDWEEIYVGTQAFCFSQLFEEFLKLEALSNYLFLDDSLLDVSLSEVVVDECVCSASVELLGLLYEFSLDGCFLVFLCQGALDKVHHLIK
jgi:hypothetical protein